MSLQPQPDVVMVPRQHQHPVRQVAGRIEVRCPGKVPQTEERDQQLIGIAAILAEIPRTRVSFCRVGRCKSIRLNQGDAIGKPQFDFLPVTFRRLRQRTERCETSVEMTDRLAVRRTLGGILPRLQPLIDRAFGVSGSRQVMGEQFWLALDQIGEMLFQRSCDARVQFRRRPRNRVE